MMYGIDGQGNPRPALSEGSTVRFGFIGSMSEHKGAHVLVTAFRRLAPELSATLTVFGTSPETAYTRRLRLLAGNDTRIAFRPTFAPDQIGAALDEIDCLVIPSLWPENAPLVALSAQAAGRAILASNVPGISEAAPAAEVFREGDVDDLARNLQKLVARPALLHEQIGRTRRPKSIAKMTDETLEFYRVVRDSGRG
jgi:glycosyltransferase involved in cell wall biosynthesis